MSCLYIHIPFCLKKCHYCSFASGGFTTELQGKYLKALEVELRGVAEKNPDQLATLFIGGGTPTTLQAEALSSLILRCEELFGFLPHCEISVEANPGTVDKRYFEHLLDAGVNRLSIGVQSFNERELAAIGRLHDRREAIEACKAAMAAGFSNINLDLMYGLPGQSPNSWAESLNQAFELKIQHLSLYQLMVEEGTPIGRMEERGELQLPGEEEILEMDFLTRERCKEKLFEQYETSNFSMVEYECLHNINYWENNVYLAAGVAAVSYQNGVREKRVGDPKKYIKAVFEGVSIIEEREQLDQEASFRETVIMGLRMKRGVNLEQLHSRYSMTPAEYYGSSLMSLLDNGMVELTGTHLRITEKGWSLSNQIMAELV